MRVLYRNILVCLSLTILCFAFAPPVMAQKEEITEWTDLEPDALPPGGSVGPWNPAAQGTLTFYPDRASFQAAHPGLPLEDFSDGLVGPGGVQACTDLPSDSTSNDACFQPGDILPGVAYDLVPPPAPPTPDNVLLGIGFLGTTCYALGPNTFDDDMEISFDPPVAAVGFDMQSFSPFTFGVEIFGPGGSLGTTMLPVGAFGTLTFFGVDTSDPGGISSIVTTGAVGALSAEVTCNIEFGGTAVPTLPDWAMLAMLTVLLAIPTVLLRRRQSA